MLIPGQIPSEEPQIRVGIILPEDSYTSITMTMPGDKDYQGEFAGRTFALGRNTECFFKLEKGQIHVKCGEKEFQAEKEIQLYPVIDVKRLTPCDGILIKNVVTGRGFHWKKNIDVILPGKVIIERLEDRLILINELPIEHYLMCVATSEMGAACPSALIEAQTIAARSWMLANVEQKHLKHNMDACNDDCCQRYQGTTFLTEHSAEGALNTCGKVLIYSDKICDARYSKSCGGVMESFEAIWDCEPVPYLQVKADAEEEPMEWREPLSDERNFRAWVKSMPMTFCSNWVVPEKELKKYLGNVDEEGKYFRWETIVTQDELTANINNFHDIQAEAIINLEVLKRCGSGRINQLAVEYIDKNNENQILLLDSEYSVRQSLHRKFLYSSAFIVIPEMGKEGLPGQFALIGAGWGHGVGLCQIGALGMALKNYSAEEIVAHYYPGSTLKRIY